VRRAALVLGVLALAGCGGDQEAESEGRPAAASPQAEMATTVAIKDFTYKPGEITVSAGDEVTWSNADASNHNVVFDDDSQESIPNLREGEKASVAFKKSGSFAYVCTYHPGMEGRVVVQ